MAKKVLDFDRYLQERRKDKGFEFSVFGQTFNLPPTIPFAVMLQFERIAKRGADEDVDNTIVVELFKNIIGDENYQKLTEHNEFDVDLMVVMLNQILELYGMNDPKRKATEKAATE